ncbi:hypothetical protein [Myroides phaeus]|uniref:Uncharacterized protein n=1 Tax=Myroides phaeus TaxID=702745 RepID=A0A1G8D794_9FLAO|nr:hypothetical protein [Myroides phaeus]SDH53551.1 hypothetical protein SAMN05421818_10630 [Myroides phaeus]
MRRYFLICAALLGVSFLGHAQVGIGTKKPATSAMLDIHSGERGILIPRVALRDLNVLAPVISNPGEDVASLLVYNTNPALDKNTPTSSQGFYYWTGTKWTKVIDRSELERILEENNAQSDDKIIEIIKIITQEASEKGKGISVVLYDFTKEVFYTLVTDDKGNVIQSEEIDLGPAIRKEESKTFIRPIYEKAGDTKSKIVKYVYFNEQALGEWLKVKSNTAENIPNEKGQEIDVIGVVSNNFQEIFNQNKEEITKIFKTIKGGITIEKEGDTWIVKIGDGNGGQETINFYELETKTYFNRGEVLKDGDKPALSKVITWDESKLKKGHIFYEYLGEERDANGKRVPYYIDMTADVITSITNNESLQTIINDNITTHLTKGGNVYYGDHDGDSKTSDVLYVINNKGEKVVINLGKTIREIFKNDKEFVREIRESLGYDITTIVESTGNKFDGKLILTYKGVTTVTALDAETSGVSIPVSHQGKKIEVIDIVLINSANQVEKTGITDIEVTADKIKFSLGSGILYTTLPAGTYQVIVQFVEEK